MSRLFSSTILIIVFVGLGTGLAAAERLHLVGAFWGHQVRDLVSQAKPGATLPERIWPVLAYRFTYDSAYQGRDITASAILLRPLGPGRRDLVSLQHGTIIADAEAPTAALHDLVCTGRMEFNLADAFFFAAHGDMVIAADYFGYGSSADMLHPYLVRDAGAIATADALRAGLRLLRWRTRRLSGDLHLVGYSEGGQVTLSLKQALEVDPIPGQTVVSTAVGATPHDVLTTGAGALAFDAPGSTIFFGYAFHSFNTYALGRPAASTFQSPWDDQVDEIYGGAYDSRQIAGLIPLLPSEFFQPTIIGGVLTGTDQALLSTLVANSTVNDTPTGPVLLFHSAGDSTVPSFNSLLAYQNMATAGVDVSLAPIDPATGGLADLGDHTAAATYAAWLDAVIGLQEAVAAPRCDG